MEINMPPESDVPEQIKVRYEKREKFFNDGVNPYRNGLKPDSLAAQLHDQYDQASREELEQKKANTSISGRVMAIRDFGKSGFLTLRDRSGTVQLYFEKKTLEESAHGIYKQLDVGDIIFAQGFLFKT